MYFWETTDCYLQAEPPITTYFTVGQRLAFSQLHFSQRTLRLSTSLLCIFWRTLLFSDSQPNLQHNFNSFFYLPPFLCPIRTSDHSLRSHAVHPALYSTEAYDAWHHRSRKHLVYEGKNVNLLGFYGIIHGCGLHRMKASNILRSFQLNPKAI